MSKVIFATDKKVAEALSIAVPEFADADIQIGYDDAQEAVRDKLVLTDYMPANMQAIADRVVLAQFAIKKQASRDKFNAEELADELSYLNVYTVKRENLKEERSNW